MVTTKIHAPECPDVVVVRCANCAEGLYHGDEGVLSAGETYCCRTCADEAAQAAVEPEMVRPRRTRVAFGHSTLDVQGWEFRDGRD